MFVAEVVAVSHSSFTNLDVTLDLTLWIKRRRGFVWLYGKYGTNPRWKREMSSSVSRIKTRSTSTCGAFTGKAVRGVPSSSKIIRNQNVDLLLESTPTTVLCFTASPCGPSKIKDGGIVYNLLYVSRNKSAVSCSLRRNCPFM